MKKLEDLQCPFCETPLKIVTPSNKTQVKCEYCGGIILIPSSDSGSAQQCPHHPQTSATGLCNDCNKAFCIACLKKVEIRKKGERTKNLFLCPNCFKNRRNRIAGALGIAAFNAGAIFLVFAYMFTRISIDLANKFIFISTPLIVFGLFGIFWAWKSPRSMKQLLASLRDSLKKFVRRLRKKGI